MPSPMMQQRSMDDTSFVQLLLEREDKMEAKTDRLREEAKAEKEDLRQQMDAKMDQMCEALTSAPPKVAISEQQVAALQARLEALHGAKLLSDDEQHALEDLVADYLELEATMGTVTLELAQASEAAGKLLKLVALSERIAADGAFARQARRKYV